MQTPNFANVWNFFVKIFLSLERGKIFTWKRCLRIHTSILDFIGLYLKICNLKILHLWILPWNSIFPMKNVCVCVNVLLITFFSNLFRWMEWLISLIYNENIVNSCLNGVPWWPCILISLIHNVSFGSPSKKNQQN